MAMRIIRDTFLIVITTILILSASAFYISYLYKAAFVPIAKSITSSTVGTLVNNESFIETIGIILAVVLAFQGALLLLTYKVLQRDIATLAERKIKLFAESERKASRAETHLAQSYLLGVLYNPSDAKQAGFIDIAILHDYNALSEVEGLDKEYYGDIIYRAKNFLVYDIAERSRNEKELLDQKDKEIALAIKDELWKLLVSGEARKYIKDVTRWEETVAWVTLCFSENQQEKEKARNIVRALEKKSNPNWFKQILKKYKNAGFDI